MLQVPARLVTDENAGEVAVQLRSIHGKGLGGGKGNALQPLGGKAMPLGGLSSNSGKPLKGQATGTHQNIDKRRAFGDLTNAAFGRSLQATQPKAALSSRPLLKPQAPQPDAPPVERLFGAGWKQQQRNLEVQESAAEAARGRQLQRMAATPWGISHLQPLQVRADSDFESDSSSDSDSDGEAGGVWGRQREREDPVVVGLGLAPRVGGSGSGIAAAPRPAPSRLSPSKLLPDLGAGEACNGLDLEFDLDFDCVDHGVDSNTRTQPGTQVQGKAQEVGQVQQQQQQVVELSLEDIELASDYDEELEALL